MKRKAMVPPYISRAIRSFGLPREILLDLMMRIHDEKPRDYDSSKYHRLDDGRRFFYRIALLSDEGSTFYFSLSVDDATTPDHLMVVNIGYVIL